MIRCGTTCSTRSPNPTPGMQILLILWLQVMYHQGRTNESLSMEVVSTYGINHTSSEFALTACLEGVYRQKKASRSQNDATHHHMEDIMVHDALMQRSSKVDFSGQPCMKTRRTLSGGVDHVRGMGTSIQEMSCQSPTISRSNFSMSGVFTTCDHFQNQRIVSTYSSQQTMSHVG